jgi:septal ring factor EnvC (AmiA/AmiB activator)
MLQSMIAAFTLVVAMFAMWHAIILEPIEARSLERMEVLTERVRRVEVRQDKSNESILKEIRNINQSLSQLEVYQARLGANLDNLNGNITRLSKQLESQSLPRPLLEARNQ